MLPFKFLPADLQYCIDGAIDAGHITALTYSTLFLFGDPKEIDRIQEAPRQGRSWMLKLGAMAHELDRYAMTLVAQLPAHVQRGLVASALIRAKQDIHDTAEVMAGWNFEDTLVGGALLPWKTGPSRINSYVPTKRLARRLASPNAIRRYVNVLCACRDECIEHRQPIYANIRIWPWPDSIEEVKVVDALYAERRRANEELVEKIKADLHAKVQAMSISLEEWEIQRGIRKPYRILTKPDRKKLIRAYSFAASLLGASQVAAFAHGQPVTIKGNEMAFEVTRGSNLLAQSHGALQIAVASLDGVRLGNLCFYFDNTPALDQLAALAMHVSAGEEKKVLATANMINVTTEGADHPIIKERAAERARLFPPVQTPNHGDNHPLFGTRWERQRAAQQAYFAEVGHIYQDAIEVALWGRDVKRYQKLIGAA